LWGNILAPPPDPHHSDEIAATEPVDMLNFKKFKFLAANRLQVPCCIILPNFCQAGGEIWLFFDFSNMAATVILDFQKFEILTAGQLFRANMRNYANFSVKRLLKYDDLTVFKMAAVRHLGFLKFKFLTVGMGKGLIVQDRATLLEVWSNLCRNMVIFRFSNIAAAATLYFEKF